MPELLAARSILFKANVRKLESPWVNLDPLADIITIKIRRPTSTNGVAWNSSCAIQVTVEYECDGVVYNGVGRVRGGIRKDRQGNDAEWYSFSHGIPYFRNPDESEPDAIVNDEPYKKTIRLGQKAKTSWRGRLVLEQIEGKDSITTELSLAAYVSNEPVLWSTRHSVAVSGTASQTEEAYGDGSISISKAATSGDTAAVMLSQQFDSSGSFTETVGGGAPDQVLFDSVGAVGGLDIGISAALKWSPSTSSTAYAASVASPSIQCLTVIMFTGSVTSGTMTAGTPATGTADPVTTGTLGTTPENDDLVIDCGVYFENTDARTPGANQTAVPSPATNNNSLAYLSSTQPGSAGTDAMTWTTGDPDYERYAWRTCYFILEASAGGSSSVPGTTFKGMFLGTNLGMQRHQ